MIKCYICEKETQDQKHVLGWAILCSQECEDKMYKESFNTLDCKSCEDKCEIPKK